MEVGPIQNRKYALITAYVNGTLSTKDIAVAESRIGKDSNLREYYSQKLEEQKFLTQLIPNITTTKRSMKNLRSEIYTITDQVFPKEKKTILGKFKDLMDKSIITFEY